MTINKFSKVILFILTLTFLSSCSNEISRGYTSGKILKSSVKGHFGKSIELEMYTGKMSHVCSSRTEVRKGKTTSKSCDGYTWKPVKLEISILFDETDKNKEMREKIDKCILNEYTCTLKYSSYFLADPLKTQTSRIATEVFLPNETINFKF